MSSTAVDTDFEKLIAYIKRARGFDFSGYKRTSLGRRIRKRMQEVGIAEYADYLDLLEATPDEFEALFDTILINVTRFFRDPPIWDYLRDDVIPELLGRIGENSSLRIWSAGCASGEEPYTLAMVLAEALGEAEYLERVKVFATDVDETELDEARHAVYDERRVTSVPEPMRERFFERLEDGSYMFRKELRRSVIFGRNDLTRDAPISRLDMLVCRNTLMYFNSDAQQEILRRLHLALRDDGILILGKSETLLSFTDTFEPIDLSKRVFRKVPGTQLRPTVPIPVALPALAEADGTHTLPYLRSGFGASPVAQVVVDIHGLVVLANEQARKLFGVSTSDIGRPLQDLQLSYRPIELRSLIERANADGEPVRINDVVWSGNDGVNRQLEVEVAPLTEAGHGSVGTSISFLDVTQYRLIWEELQRSKRDLEAAYEELQSTVEELETTNEELQSTNEELETTNEELQSTNEELETMNEELQSSNEELETTNEELRIRTAELNYANTLMDSMVASLGVAVAVVDRELRVQLWNDRAKELWGLDFTDVRGQHVLDLDIGLPVERLRTPLRKCLANGATQHPTRKIPARDRRGKDIVCAVRCAPLTARDGAVNGAVVMMEVPPPRAADGAKPADGSKPAAKKPAAK
jgi:two-component system, chemotaxis family, CheB/CheR fusion protein